MENFYFLSVYDFSFSNQKMVTVNPFGRLKNPKPTTSSCITECLKKKAILLRVQNATLGSNSDEVLKDKFHL